MDRISRKVFPVMPDNEVMLNLQKLNLPDPLAMGLVDTITIYESMRPMMPVPRNVSPKHLLRLVDIIPEVDALILDGYGVINVGSGPITGIGELFDCAANRNVPIIVLTNGASFGAEVAWQKYRKWGLPIARDHVVSSRDALEAALKSRSPGLIYGSLSGTSAPLGIVMRSITIRMLDFSRRLMNLYFWARLTGTVMIRIDLRRHCGNENGAFMLPTLMWLHHRPVAFQLNQAIGRYER